MYIRNVSFHKYHLMAARELAVLALHQDASQSLSAASNLVRASALEVVRLVATGRAEASACRAPCSLCRAGALFSSFRTVDQVVDYLWRGVCSGCQNIE
jgi:hypothetical protein